MRKTVLISTHIIKCTFVKLNISDYYDKIRDFTAILFGRLYYMFIRIITYYIIKICLIFFRWISQNENTFNRCNNTRMLMNVNLSAL